MAVIDTVRQRFSAAEVAEFVQRLWSRSGEPAEVLSEVFVVLPRSGRVECVFDDLGALAKSRDTIAELLRHGIDVNALLPVPLLGRAHEELRGMGISLQGWLEAEDGTPRFISPERA